MVEVMVALTLMTVAVYLLSSTITSVMVNGEAKRVRVLAVDAAMNRVEEMRSVRFRDLFALYNETPDDDPVGPGTAPGAHFDVDGLTPAPGDPDGHVGCVLFPSTTTVLREDAAVPELGLPRDLDGNLRVDTLDHAKDYIVLPAIVRIEWASGSHSRRFEMSTMFAGLEKRP